MIALKKLIKILIDEISHKEYYVKQTKEYQNLLLKYNNLKSQNERMIGKPPASKIKMTNELKDKMKKSQVKEYNSNIVTKLEFEINILKRQLSVAKENHDKLRSEIQLFKSKCEFHKEELQNWKKQFFKLYETLTSVMENNNESILKITNSKFKEFNLKIENIKKILPLLSNKKCVEKEEGTSKNEAFWKEQCEIRKEIRSNLRLEEIPFMQIHLPVYIKYDKNGFLSLECLKNIFSSSPYSLKKESQINVISTIFVNKFSHQNSKIKTKQFKHFIRNFIGYYNIDISRPKILSLSERLANEYQKILKQIPKEDRRERLCKSFEEIVSSFKSIEISNKIKTGVIVKKVGNNPTKVIEISKLFDLVTELSKFTSSNIDFASFCEEYGLIKHFLFILASPLSKAIKDVGLKHELESRMNKALLGQLYALAVYLKESGMTVEQLFSTKLINIGMQGRPDKLICVIREASFIEILKVNKIYFLDSSEKYDYGSLIVSFKEKGTFIIIKILSKIVDMFGINYELCFKSHEAFLSLTSKNSTNQPGESNPNKMESESLQKSTLNSKELLINMDNNKERFAKLFSEEMGPKINLGKEKNDDLEEIKEQSNEYSELDSSKTKDLNMSTKSEKNGPPPSNSEI